MLFKYVEQKSSKQSYKVIDIALKTTQTIIYPKGHDGIFKLIEARCKCGLPLITFLYLKTVKSGNNIKLSINFSLTKPLKGLIYKWYRVLVFNCNNIKFSIVNAELNTFFQLFGKKDKSS